MSDPITQYAETLANADAGWVNRRDAAEALGEMAGRSLAALRDCRKDEDTDVRTAVRSALGAASASIRGVPPVVSSRRYSLEELVRAAEKPERRIVTAKRSGFEVKVHVKEGRTQTVSVEAHSRKDGVELVSVFTRCGPADESAFRWALGNNLKLHNCAMAIKTIDGEDAFVLANTMRQEYIVPEEMKAAIKEIAYYGDWIENKLTGRDLF